MAQVLFPRYEARNRFFPQEVPSPRSKDALESEITSFFDSVAEWLIPPLPAKKRPPNRRRLRKAKTEGNHKLKHKKSKPKEESADADTAIAHV